MKFQGRMSFCILQFNLNFHGISCIPTSLSLFFEDRASFLTFWQKSSINPKPPFRIQKAPYGRNMQMVVGHFISQKGISSGKNLRKRYEKIDETYRIKLSLPLEIISRQIVWRFLITLLWGLETNFSFILMGFCNLIPKIDKWIQSFCISQ